MSEARDDEVLVDEVPAEAGPVDEVRVETLELLRRFADLAVSADVPEAAWARLRDTLADVVGEHGTDGVTESTYAARFREAIAADPDNVPDVHHPLVLGHTPVFPAFELEWVEGKLRASVEFGHAFEGPPGLVHGGFVATGFDIVVSGAAWKLAPLNMTRRLNIRYFRPTPVGQVLVFEAEPSWIDDRRVHVECRLFDESGKTTARAQGECVTFEATRFGHRL